MELLNTHDHCTRQQTLVGVSLTRLQLSNFNQLQYHPISRALSTSPSTMLPQVRYLEIISPKRSHTYRLRNVTGLN
jgi:hypothetical protein